MLSAIGPNTPQRQKSPRPRSPHSPRSPRSPKSPRSPRTPRKPLTPITQHAIQMSTTPIRNRLMLTPTRNNQRQVYDPLKDLQLLGRLFHAKTKMAAKAKSKIKTKAPISSPIDKNNKSVNLSLDELTRSILSSHTSPRIEIDREDASRNSPALNADITSSIQRSLLSSPSQNVNPPQSPTPNVNFSANANVIPSFVNRDVRAFARLIHHSSSFTSHRTSLGSHMDSQSDTSGYIEDTLQITQSQSQSQSQTQSQTQQRFPLQYEDQPELEGMEPDDEVPEFSHFHDTTFESHADTSTVALPEAILRNGSGILGMSEDEEDGDINMDEYEDDIYQHNLSIVAGTDTSESSDYDDAHPNDIGMEDISNHHIPDTIADNSFSDLSLIRIHDENVTLRKHQRLQNKANREKNRVDSELRVSKPAAFNSRMIKSLFECIQIPSSLATISPELFNDLSNRFIDLELQKSLEMSNLAELNDRIVYADVLDHEEVNEPTNEDILMYAMHEWDLETVKDLEAVLYNNKALRNKRKKASELKKLMMLSKDDVDAFGLDVVDDENEERDTNDEKERNDDEIDLEETEKHVELGAHEQGSDFEDTTGEDQEPQEETDAESSELLNPTTLDPSMSISIGILTQEEGEEISSDFEIPLAVEEEEEEEEESDMDL